MTTAAVLAAALLVPWAVGTAALLTLTRWSKGDVPRSIAYGQLAGIAILTLSMRIASYAGLPWSFPVLISLLGVLLAAFAIIAGRSYSPTSRESYPTHSTDGVVWRSLALLAGALLVVRFASLAYDVVLQPLYPWDAWTQWATKAKVWSALHRIAPFIGYEQWLARQPGYVDTAPHYPATMPLLQAWIALALGRFDDALVNLPWLALYVALGLGVYAQLRALDATRSLALVATYMILSLPLLDTHVALAGYADLPVAAAVALGLLALLRWEREREAIELVYVLLAVVLLPTLKVPGVVWAATLLLGLLIAAFGRSFGRTVLVTLAMAAASAAVVLVFFRGKLVSVSAQAQAQIAEPLFTNLFLFDNWHLLWYIVPVAVALAWREAVRMRGASAVLVAGFAFLWVTFAFTQVGNWVADYTTVNRAFLHIAPAALAFAAYLFAQWTRRRESAVVPAALAQPAEASTPAVPAGGRAS